jgi:hypothetical protein
MCRLEPLKLENARSMKNCKIDNESIISEKHSVKSINLSERKFKKNMHLKIKTPSIDELIKKPDPIKCEGITSFINNLSCNSKDLRSIPNNTPSSQNLFVNTPNIFQAAFQKGSDPKDYNYPLVFSRGQTPEMTKGMTPNKNIFSFDQAKSPGIM